MAESYRLDEVRFVVDVTLVSAADATLINSVVCPEGKILTILQMSVQSSAVETRLWNAALITRSGGIALNFFGPTSAVQDAGTSGIALLVGGHEIQLYPGDKVSVFRNNATAGSTMTLRYRYVLCDLPQTTYFDPQKIKVLRRHSAGNPAAGGFVGVGGAPGSSGGPGGGGSGGRHGGGRI